MAKGRDVPWRKPGAPIGEAVNLPNSGGRGFYFTTTVVPTGTRL